MGIRTLPQLGLVVLSYSAPSGRQSTGGHGWVAGANYALAQVGFFDALTRIVFYLGSRKSKEHSAFAGRLPVLVKPLPYDSDEARLEQVEPTVKMRPTGIC
jgi:hypothetical protein